MTTATKRAKKKAKVTMLSVKNRRRVERATVRLVERGGQGVLIPGELILTATHCIGWSGTGGMALGGEYPTDIETVSGIKFRTGVYSCDPVADIAAHFAGSTSSWELSS